MKSGQESSEMEKVTGFRSRYTCVLFRQKQEQAVILFSFWMQLFLARCHPFSFLFSSILPFFLPSLRFFQFHQTVLTHTHMYNWTGTWCTTACSITFIQEQMFFSASHIALSLWLTFSWTVHSWSFFSLFLFLV